MEYVEYKKNWIGDHNIKGFFKISMILWKFLFQKNQYKNLQETK